MEGLAALGCGTMAVSAPQGDCIAGGKSAAIALRTSERMAWTAVLGIWLTVVEGAAAWASTLIMHVATTGRPCHMSHTPHPLAGASDIMVAGVVHRRNESL